MEKQMARKIRRLSVACAFVMTGQLIVPSSAKTEVINIACHCDACTNHASWNAWIDTNNKTITIQGFAADGKTIQYTTLPVQITPLSYIWDQYGTHIIIDRTTGVYTQTMPKYPNNPIIQQCSKGSTPMPAPKL
jgi:hypothetical protein